MIYRVIALAAVLVSGRAEAAITFFDWTPVSATTGTGAADSYTAVYSLQPVANITEYVSDHPAYLSKYPAIMEGLVIESGSALSGTFLFAQPLPIGSVMMVLDVDRGESMSFSSAQQFSLVENLERLAGGDSDFPTWNQSSQTLLSTLASRSDSAITVLDVSGLSNVSFTFQSAGTTGTAIGFGVTAVPEPSAVVLLALACPACFVWWRTVNKSLAIPAPA